MSILFAFLVFVAVVALVSMVGMKIYVRPKEAMERVAGGIDPAEHTPAHPSARQPLGVAGGHTFEE